MQAIGRSVLLAALFCAALYLYALTRAFEFPRVPGRLGPDVWPQTILVLLMIACAVGIGRDLLSRRGEQSAQPRDAPDAAPGDTGSQQLSARLGYTLVGGGFLLFLGYPVALEYLGFPLATFLLMALFMLLGRWRNALGVVLVSAAGTLALFYTFRGLVYVSLPLGTGPFQSATLWIARLLGMR